MLDQGLDRDALQDSGELELLIVRIGNPRIQLNFGFGFADGQLEQTLVTTRNAVCQPTTSKPLSPTHSPCGHTRTAEDQLYVTHIGGSAARKIAEGGGSL